MRDETEAPAPAAPQRKLKPANENPWYVLMTLYGEDRERNREAWNAWVKNGISGDHVLKKWQENSPAKFPNLIWNNDQVIRFHEECERRGLKGSELPNVETEIKLFGLDFSEGLNLDGYFFPQQMTIANCDFGEFSARDAHFVGVVTLEDNTFRSSLVLYCALFSGEYYSSGNDFAKGANFRYAKFEGLMTSLGDDYSQEAAFSGNRFLGQVNFGYTRFGQSAAEIDHDCLFQNCEFLAPTNFREAKFEEFYPDFHGVLLHERTLFSAGDEFWPKSVRQPLEQARSTCSSIRHILAKQSLPEDEHFFFRREMHFAGQIGSIWQRLPYLLFGWFSDYGHSIARPFWWLFVVWLLGTLVIAEHFVAETAKPLFGSNDWTAMALSFSNLFPVFGFGRAYFSADFLQALPQHLKALSGFQTVASLPLLFFLGLGLRQRFRLR